MRVTAPTLTPMPTWLRRALPALALVVLCAVDIAATDADAAVKRGRLSVAVGVTGTPTAGSAVTVTVRTGSARRRPIRRYTLDFGDGTRVKRGRRPPRRTRHVYRAPGRYTVRVVLVDRAGKRVRGSSRVTVRARPGRPISAIAGSGSQSGGATGGPAGTGGGGTTPIRPLALRSSEIEVVEGSQVALTVPAPMISISHLDPPAAGPLTALRRDGGITVAATSGAAAGRRTLQLSGRGCTADACERAFVLEVPVVIRALAAPPGPMTGFTAASPDRVAAAARNADGLLELGDELLVTLGTPDVVGSRADAEEVAAAVGGTVSGGIEEIGVYEIRWSAPQDLAAREEALAALPGVTAVSRQVYGLVGTDAAPPGDWDDDYADDQARWPFIQIRAEEAWDTTTGSDITVGIVDGGTAYADHEDLNVVTDLGGGRAGHATHVAGLACGRANGKGLVGVAWGCPVVTRGASGDDSTIDKAVLVAAVGVALEPDVKVVNMSLGHYYGKYCHTAAELSRLNDKYTKPNKAAFRNLFQGPIGRGIVWTLSAGNICTDGMASPWAANADLPNVISVAATNANGNLARFSSYGNGVEVAAPGGVGTQGVGLWSTLFESCWSGLRTCSTYGVMSGTSMSAPVVAGVAALVRSAHPSFGAVEAAACITQTAGDQVGFAATQDGLPSPGQYSPAAGMSYVTNSLPIVNAEAAVRCDTFDSSAAGSYVGSWQGSGWILDMAEEEPGVLGAVNQATTPFVNGCTRPPGQRLLTGMSHNGSGQWNGSTVFINHTCTSTFFLPLATMRAVRDGDTILLRMAWPHYSDAPRPTIDEDGVVTASGPFTAIWLTRPGSRRTGRLDGSAQAPHPSAPEGSASVLAAPAPASATRATPAGGSGDDDVTHALMTTQPPRS